MSGDSRLFNRREDVNYPDIELFPKNCVMYVDVLKSQQMFMNLLNNACKYTPVGGHVTMRFKHLKAEGNLSTDQIIIKDDGCGMSEEFLK